MCQETTIKSTDHSIEEQNTAPHLETNNADQPANTIQRKHLLADAISVRRTPLQRPIIHKKIFRQHAQIILLKNERITTA